MGIDVLEAVVATVMGLAVFATFVSFIVSIIGLLQTAKRRIPEISLIKALASRNVIFCPELYSQDAQRWRKLHIIGFVGVVASVATAAGASVLLSLFGG
jgi:hypothetical protein